MKNKSQTLSKLNVLMILLTLLTCIIYMITYIVKKDYFMAISCIIVMFLPFAIYIIERIIKHKIHDGIKLTYLYFIFMSAVLGAIGNFYGGIFLYDKIIHFISGMLTGTGFLIFLHYYKKDIEYDKTALVVISVFFSAAIAAFWEICEFTFDSIFHKQVQLGLTDTMFDMIVAIIASLILSIIYVNIADKDKNGKITRK